MKKTFLFLLLACIVSASISAQISIKDFKPFIGNQKLVDTLFNGSRQDPKEVLLILIDNEEDDFQKMILLQNTKGKLEKIAENDELIMNLGMLGVLGNNYSTFSENVIDVAYSLGSNSASSDVSIQFEKNKRDGNYYFKAYYLINYNFGVENLFTREMITNLQTGEIKFSEATEELIFRRAKLIPLADSTVPLYKTAKDFAKYTPQDWNFAKFSEGDLNLDNYKKDLLLMLYNEDHFKIELLMEQKEGGYKTVAVNDKLIKLDDTFNINNFKAVIKNGYFTIEQRIATADENFDQRYLTFKYDAASQSWLLHRYDVEHYSGFNTKPSADIIHLTKRDFGIIPFKDLDNPPKY